jgi:hypothetical protein
MSKRSEMQKILQVKKYNIKVGKIGSNLARQSWARARLEARKHRARARLEARNYVVEAR